MTLQYSTESSLASRTTISHLFGARLAFDLHDLFKFVDESSTLKTGKGRCWSKLHMGRHSVYVHTIPHPDPMSRSSCFVFFSSRVFRPVQNRFILQRSTGIFMMLPSTIRETQKTKIDEVAKGKGGLRFQRLSNEPGTGHLGSGVQPVDTWGTFFILASELKSLVCCKCRMSSHGRCFAKQAPPRVALSHTGPG